MTPDRFEDHAWADVVPEDLMRLYTPYQRETFVGPRPALVLIDLYNSAYRGGPMPPVSLIDQYPSSCGIYAHNAIEPTKRLIAAARAAGIPIFYCTSDNHPMAAPQGGGATRRKKASAVQCLPTITRSGPISLHRRVTSSSASSAPASSRALR